MVHSKNKIYPGKFITFEGGEGAGKSTLIKFLQEKLTSLGEKVVLTREPGGSEGAEAIRDIILQGDVERWDFISEAFLFFAGRRDHLDKTIWPAMERGEWVLCDRFMDSSHVYQWMARELPDYVSIDDFHHLVRMTVGSFKPELTFLLDVPAEVGLKRSLDRIAQQSVKENRFENMDVAYHENVRQAYLKIAADEPERFFIIDGLLSPSEIRQVAWKKMCEQFQLQGEVHGG